MILRASLSFNGKDLELFTIYSPTPTQISPSFKKLRNSFEKRTGLDGMSRSYSNSSLSPHSHTNKHHQAALRLQKVYKSFRTRRRLADCAVLVEQRWWRLMDFAELKRSSISFFDIETNETAVSKWSRATTRAAKVGKGLSKDEKARKLALQHWLEAIDPRHRYGHNLQFYYARWLRCDSKQPFFYWLDIGEGKDVNLEWCSRQKLQQQCIKYLGPVERKAYEVVIMEGKFVFRQSGKLVDTIGGPEEKWIFVLSTSKVLYVGKKKKGTFQHSSFLAGGATLSAGRLVVHNGVLKALWPHSGHYLPTEENFQELVSFLKEHSVDLSDVKRSPTADDAEAMVLGGQKHFPCFPSTQDLTRLEKTNDREKPNPMRLSTWSRRRGSDITKLEIPNPTEATTMFKNRSLTLKTPSEDGYETADTSFSEEEFMVPKINLFDQEEAHDVSKEMIMQRIDSHKGMRSYQLAQQLTSRWTTGAGPRIGCMRDYPVELQVRVLEESRLSPRGVIIRASTPPRTRFGSMSLLSPILTPGQSWPGGSPTY